MNTYREDSAADGKAESESEREEGDGGGAFTSPLIRSSQIRANNKTNQPKGYLKFLSNLRKEICLFAPPSHVCKTSATLGISFKNVCGCASVVV